MAERANFTGFESYQLTGVRVTDRELGHGSYATVQELEYMGLKCAGKMIHEVLLRQGDNSYYVRRFEEECRLLSQVRHPNIVQFLGVLFQQGVRVPILVMEYLPTNLTSCIEQYGILPNEISYSILHDVALGLFYFHSQTPPIIHRDLSSNNVLLTANMTAKISDLGVARILNLTPLQVSRMTQAPGTPAYMPPEVMVANPKYDTSIDEFSYGILMIHMFSGRWPEPQVGQIRTDNGEMIPVSEAERREVFLQAIGNDHPLMDLILRCINNHPECRLHSNKIVEQLATKVAECPIPFADRLELLMHIEQKAEEKRVLMKEKEEENKQNQQTILKLLEEVQEKESEIERLSLTSSVEGKQYQFRIRQMNSEYQLLATTSEARVTELKAKLVSMETQMETNNKATKQEREEYEIQLAREKESRGRLETENHKLKTSIHVLQQNNSTLQGEISKKEAVLQLNKYEIEARKRALEEKDSIISDVNAQLTRTREYMSSKKQVRMKVLVHTHEEKMLRCMQCFTSDVSACWTQSYFIGE